MNRYCFLFHSSWTPVRFLQFFFFFFAKLFRANERRTTSCNHFTCSTWTMIENGVIGLATMLNELNWEKEKKKCVMWVRGMRRTGRRVLFSTMCSDDVGTFQPISWSSVDAIRGNHIFFFRIQNVTHRQWKSNCTRDGVYFGRDSIGRQTERASERARKGRERIRLKF